MNSMSGPSYWNDESTFMITEYTFSYSQYGMKIYDVAVIYFPTFE